MKMNRCCLLMILYLSCLVSSGVDRSVKSSSNDILDDVNTKNLQPEKGLTKLNLNLNKETAVKIAEVILSSIYGEKVLQQRPWLITDNGTSFKIMGTFHSDRFTKGGVAEITISKSDARVLQYSHEK